MQNQNEAPDELSPGACPANGGGIPPPRGKGRRDKIFPLLLIISSVLLAAAVTENIRSVLMPQPATIKIDVAKVRAGIAKAGLVPREALYGKEL